MSSRRVALAIWCLLLCACTTIVPVPTESQPAPSPAPTSSQAAVDCGTYSEADCAQVIAVVEDVVRAHGGARLVRLTDYSGCAPSWRGSCPPVVPFVEAWDLAVGVEVTYRDDWVTQVNVLREKADSDPMLNFPVGWNFERHED